MSCLGIFSMESPVLLAPLAGYTDKAFRLMVKSFGCGAMISEMVSAKALTYGNERTMALLEFSNQERPMGVQLFGNDPKIMAAGARLAWEHARPDFIDINMGCPVPKVVNNQEGCALMLNIPLAAEVVRAVNQAVPCPVTVKMRKGFSKETVNAVELSQAVEKAGAQMVTVHGRTREQYYLGTADWGIIGAVKQGVDIPVVGNGDILKPEDAVRMIEETGCDAVMVGRGALGNPWLCRHVVEMLTTGEHVSQPSITQRFTVMKRHLALAVQHKGPDRAVREMRAHFAYYLRAMPGAAKMRNHINRAKCLETVQQLLADFEDEVVSRG